MNIYIVEVEGKYKIGLAQDIDERVRGLQAANPSDLELVHSFSTEAREAETLLHRVFKNKRIRNEWFALTPSDIAFIRTINGFTNGAFTWETTMPILSTFVSDNGRSTIVFKFTDHRGEEYHITERQVYDFLQVAWKRQQGGEKTFSRAWWTVHKRPRISIAQYHAIVSILVEKSIIINRRMGSGGNLSMPPLEAMAIIVEKERPKHNAPH